MSQDEDHLKLLAIFHYVVAGLAALVSLFPTVHLLVGIGMVSGFFTDPKDPFPFSLVGWIFITFASCWIVFGLAFSSCMVMAGRCLRQRRKYKFCLVMAGLACIFMPFGTVLGVFTIITLTSESVKALFQHPVPAEPQRQDLP